jgi:hypothetical protein
VDNKDRLHTHTNEGLDQDAYHLWLDGATNLSISRAIFDLFFFPLPLHLPNFQRVKASNCLLLLSLQPSKAAKGKLWPRQQRHKRPREREQMLALCNRETPFDHSLFLNSEPSSPQLCTLPYKV